MLKTKFGIEVEFTGITRTKASRIIEKHFGGRLTKLGGCYDNRKYTKLEKILEIFVYSMLIYKQIQPRGGYL